MIHRLQTKNLPQSTSAKFREDTSFQRVSNRILTALVDRSDDAVCCIELASGQILYANRAAGELFGYNRGDWERLLLSDLLHNDVARMKLAGTSVVESHVRHRDGRSICVQWRLVSLPHEATAAVVFRTAETIEPLSQVNQDSLTGLPNRRVFESRLKESIERRPSSCAALFLDLDDFKQVNDRFGHVVGDRVLRRVAERLVHSLRPVDTVARYGGDEFVALLERIKDEASATNAAKRLLHAISEPISVAEQDIQVSGSIGIVVGMHATPSVGATIHAADCAMYQAKSRGRGQYVVFNERACPAFSAKSGADRTPSLPPSAGDRANARRSD